MFESFKSGDCYPHLLVALSALSVLYLLIISSLPLFSQWLRLTIDTRTNGSNGINKSYCLCYTQRICLAGYRVMVGG